MSFAEVFTKVSLCIFILNNPGFFLAASPEISVGVSPGNFLRRFLPLLSLRYIFSGFIVDFLSRFVTGVPFEIPSWTSAGAIGGLPAISFRGFFF